MIVYGIAYSGSLLAWILIPVKFLLGRAPVDDDVTKFLVGSHIHPLIVMIGAIILVAVIFLMLPIKETLKKILNSVLIRGCYIF